MPDYCKCLSKDCPKYTHCLRATVESSYMQSFADLRKNTCNEHNDYIMFKKETKNEYIR